MSETDATKKRKWVLGGLFEPATDFYALLDEQAEKTLEGMRALSDWVGSSNGDERCQSVRSLENEADVLKLKVSQKLGDSFITPFDREDIYDLSLNLDEVINAAKATVREIETFSISTNASMREMTAILVEGTQCLATAIHSLRDNLPESGKQAALARKAENKMSKTYRFAMQALFQEDDVKLILRVREAYKTMMLAAERIDKTGEVLLRIVVKMS